LGGGAAADDGLELVKDLVDRALALGPGLRSDILHGLALAGGHLHRAIHCEIPQVAVILGGRGQRLIWQRRD
jgi:hypothetical protein